MRTLMLQVWGVKRWRKGWACRNPWQVRKIEFSTDSNHSCLPVPVSLLKAIIPTKMVKAKAANNCLKTIKGRSRVTTIRALSSPRRRKGFITLQWSNQVVSRTSESKKTNLEKTRWKGSNPWALLHPTLGRTNSTELPSPSLISKLSCSKIGMFWHRWKAITRSRSVKGTSNLRSSSQKTSKGWWLALISIGASRRILRSTRGRKPPNLVTNVCPNSTKKWWMSVEPKTWNFSETRARSKWSLRSQRSINLLNILHRARELKMPWHLEQVKVSSKISTRKCSTIRKTW